MSGFIFFEYFGTQLLTLPTISIIIGLFNKKGDNRLCQKKLNLKQKQKDYLI